MVDIGRKTEKDKATENQMEREREVIIFWTKNGAREGINPTQSFFFQKSLIKETSRGHQLHA